MARLFPTFENIKRFKVQPTDGEWCLIHYLTKNLSDEVEIYFQPFINGDMPDIVLIQKGVGVTIIEIKDWNLKQSYYIDSDNMWYTKKQDLVKSPFDQVKTYKDNMFDLHINGLLELKLRYSDHKQSIYGKIKTFVYFHKISRQELVRFIDKQLEKLRQEDDENNQNYKQRSITYERYNNTRYSIKTKMDNIKKEFDYSAVTNDNLEKISLPSSDGKNMLNDKIYKEFLRYLQPPLHTLDMGKDIIYTDEQNKFIYSENGVQKIKGVAGSGKTAVLAKRAVNAHKRHSGRILILTYNITLINYIHDKISDIKEKFSWDKFYIINYHEFFKQNLNYLGIEIKIPDEIEKQAKKENDDEIISKYLEDNYFSNRQILTKHTHALTKYKSIFIDEIQDYTPEWVYIIKTFMLENDGEMVLFGDEKQNLYHDTSKQKEILGFGEWNKLSQATRQSRNGDRIIYLSKKFQQEYFTNKYELDNYENQINQLKLKDGIFKIASYRKTFDESSEDKNLDIERMVKIILEEIRVNQIHNNDYCILSSRINVLKEIDYVLRKVFGIKTMTTFESKERFIETGCAENNIFNTIHRNKKMHFWSNSGTVKLATIHSYKGFESNTVFLILNKSDTSEQIYAGITRSKSNLMVFLEEDNKFKSFFAQILNKYELVKKDDDIIKQLTDCVANQLIITIEYKESNSINITHNVKPYRLFIMNSNMYLACEVDNKYKFQMFRVSNIVNIETSYHRFDINVEMDDFVAHIQTPFATYRKNYKEYLVSIIVEVDKTKAKYFKIKQFLASQKILDTLDNGNLLISYTVTQELEMEELIKKWLPYMKVIEPVGLDEKIKNDIKAYLL